MDDLKSTTLIVGMTGGIASGKSTVARAFANHGVSWIDADDVAREVVAPGEPALAEISERYGDRILLGDGRLDRRALRRIVFDDEKERHWLEATTHPRIRQRLEAWVTKQRHDNVPYALLVSPLLFESGQHQLVDRCLVIDVPESLQVQRTAQRDDVDETQARAIVDAQMSRQQRLARADDILNNAGDQCQLDEQVTRLDQYYRTLRGLPPAP